MTALHAAFASAHACAVSNIEWFTVAFTSFAILFGLAGAFMIWRDKRIHEKRAKQLPLSFEEAR